MRADEKKVGGCARIFVRVPRGYPMKFEHVDPVQSGLSLKGPSHALANTPEKGLQTHALSAARPRARPGHGGPGGHRERAGAAPTVHSLPLRDEKRLPAVGRGRGWWRTRLPRLTLS